MDDQNQSAKIMNYFPIYFGDCEAASNVSTAIWIRHRRGVGVFNLLNSLKNKELTSESWLEGQNDAHTHESVYIVLNVVYYVYFAFCPPEDTGKMVLYLNLLYFA